MAVIGKAGGYATVNPTQSNPLGEAMTNVENSAFKYREEKRIDDALREKNKVKDDLDAKFDVTGNTSINDLAVPYFMNAKMTFGENVNKINSTRDPAEKERLRQANEKIRQNISVAKQLPTILNEKQAEIAEGIKSGKFSERDSNKIAGLLEGLKGGKGKAYFDQYGNARVSFYGVNEDGTPNGEVVKDMNIAELGKNLTPSLASTYDKDIIAETKDYNLNRTVTEKGGQKITKEEIGKRDRENASNYANRVLSEKKNFDELSYRLKTTDPEVIKKEVEKNYINQLPTLNQQERDSGYASEKLAREKFEHDKSQDAIKNARELEKLNLSKSKTKEPDNTKIARFITSTEETLPDSDYVIPKGSGKIVVESKGTKDISGGIRDLQEIYVTPKGNVIYGIKEKNVDRKKLTPEAEELKRKSPSKFKSSDLTNYVSTDKIVYYDSENKGDKIAPAILNTINPDTGKKFKNTIESDAWARKNTHPEKSVQKTNVKVTPKEEYTNVTETDKGVLGVKDGKWYYVKTGKLYQ